MELKNLIINLEGEVAIISFNRPEALNALNKEVLEELEKVIDWLEGNSHIKVVILTGEGKAFVAGADIAQMKDMSPGEARQFAVLGQRVFRKIEKLEKPVIAAINGFALGGGCELAMGCDIRLASPKAKLGQPEVGLGITPGFAGTQRLSRLVGMSKAKELIFTGDPINAEEALRIGLVDRVTGEENLLEEAKNLANKIASKAFKAVKYSKAAINMGIQVDIDTGASIEADLFALCFATEDQKEGMNAFIEKRKPNFANK